MRHYVIELALWMLLIFLVGCAIGYLLRRLFGSGKTEASGAPVDANGNGHALVVAKAAVPDSPPAESPTPPATEALGESTASDASQAPPVAGLPIGRMERPKGLSAPREGKADPLQKISGIGPKYEKILHTLGFFHFDQIASWTPEQMSWVDDHLGFNGRIIREQWIEQSKLLAAGADAEFKRRFGTKKPR